MGKQPNAVEEAKVKRWLLAARSSDKRAVNDAHTSLIEWLTKNAWRKIGFYRAQHGPHEAESVVTDAVLNSVKHYDARFLAVPWCLLNLKRHLSTAYSFQMSPPRDHRRTSQLECPNFDEAKRRDLRLANRHDDIAEIDTREELYYALSLAKLTAPERLALLLRFVKGWGFVEIGKRLSPMTERQAKQRRKAHDSEARYYKIADNAIMRATSKVKLFARLNRDGTIEPTGYTGLICKKAG